MPDGGPPSRDPAAEIELTQARDLRIQADERLEAEAGSDSETGAKKRGFLSRLFGRK
jgi:hypothetical protein